MLLQDPQKKVDLIRTIGSLLDHQQIPWVLLRGYDKKSLIECNDIDLFIPSSHSELAKQLILQYARTHGLCYLPVKSHANLSYDLFLYQFEEPQCAVYLNIEVTTRIVHPLPFFGFSL